uniref:Uncharacterized protein n=1 Tax=Anguilla anguilla TaxID=7936 RepID=A0A0E9WXT4_ANGAN
MTTAKRQENTHKNIGKEDPKSLHDGQQNRPTSRVQSHFRIFKYSLKSSAPFCSDSPVRLSERNRHHHMPHQSNKNDQHSARR